MLKTNRVIFLQKKENPSYCNYIVRSRAVDEYDDPICQMVKELSLPLFRRGEFLENAYEGKKVLAIVGSHGKTSVYSDWIVVEVDENDGTMKEFWPESKIALNYDDDHIYNFGGRDGLMTTFHDLFARTRSRIFIPESEKIFSKMIRSFPGKIKK